MRSMDIVQAVAKDPLKVEEISLALKKELERIAILALFPGRCCLCAGE